MQRSWSSGLYDKIVSLQITMEHRRGRKAHFIPIYLVLEAQKSLLCPGSNVS